MLFNEDIAGGSEHCNADVIMGILDRNQLHVHTMHIRVHALFGIDISRESLHHHVLLKFAGMFSCSSSGLCR